MATEFITIKVSETGARVVKRELDGIGRTATKTQGAVKLLGRALGAIGAAAIVRGAIKLADTFTNLQNRIRTVTTGQAQLAAVTDRLFAISNKTRSSFQATTEVYARTALAVKDLGISQDETLNFTESLNQAVLLSGASATEANAAMIQLSQGLASGTLRGDELRSVLEQLPVVADVIAKGMGVTRGELRALGKEGKISADVVLNSFKLAREELTEKFAKSVPTVGQAFQVFNNQVIRFIGELDSGLGITSSFAKAIIFLGNNVETLARIFGAAAIAIGIKFAAEAIPAAIRAIRLLTLAIAANPLGALLTALTVGISLLISFSDQIMLSGDGITTLADLFVATFDTIVEGLQAMLDIFEPAFQQIAAFFEGIFGPLEFSLRGALIAVAKWNDGILGLFKGAFNAVIALWNAFPDAIGDIFIRAFNFIGGVVTDFANDTIDIINRVSEFIGAGTIEKISFDPIRSEFQGGAAALGENVAKAFEEGFKSVTVAEDLVNNVLGKADARAAQRLRDKEKTDLEQANANKELLKTGTNKVPATVTKEQEKFGEFLQDLKNENELLKLNSEERRIREALIQGAEIAKRKLTVAEKELITSLVQSNSELEKQNAVLERIQGPQTDYNDGLKTLKQLLDQGKISTEKYKEEVLKLRKAYLATQKDAQSGLERGLISINEEFSDLATLMETTVVDAFKSAEDALVNFVKTGKLDFKSLVDSILEDLIRLTIREQITGPLAAQIGGQQTGGGLFGAIAGLFGGLAGGGGVGRQTVGTQFAQQTGGTGFSGDFVPAFANGGSFEVGGHGGTDSQLVAFRASPNETVTINKPGQSDGSGNTINFNITTPDADSFRRSETQLLTRAQVALARSRARNGQ